MVCLFRYTWLISTIYACLFFINQICHHFDKLLLRECVCHGQSFFCIFMIFFPFIFICIFWSVLFLFFPRLFLYDVCVSVVFYNHFLVFNCRHGLNSLVGRRSCHVTWYSVRSRATPSHRYGQHSSLPLSGPPSSMPRSIVHALEHKQPLFTRINTR